MSTIWSKGQTPGSSSFHYRFLLNFTTGEKMKHYDNVSFTSGFAPEIQGHHSLCKLILRSQDPRAEIHWLTESIVRAIGSHSRHSRLRPGFSGILQLKPPHSCLYSGSFFVPVSLCPTATLNRGLIMASRFLQHNGMNRSLRTQPSEVVWTMQPVIGFVHS